MIKRRRRWLFFLVCTTATLTLFYIMLSLKDNGILRNLVDETCRDGLAREMLFKLCSNFSKGIVFGKLCKPLCVAKEFLVTGCIHHSQTVVINAVWKGKKVVLKRKRAQSMKSSIEYLDSFLKEPPSGETSVISKFKEIAFDEVSSALGDDVKKLSQEEKDKILDRVIQSDRKMSEMTPKEMKASLELFGLEEYLMLGLFHDLNHFATLYGSCGHIYAVEKLNPLANYFPSLRISMDWPKKAALAIDFIGLIKEFESSKYGYLHHCDIQEANFGITEDSRIKAIDVDLIFTDQRMVGILNQPNCTRDSDCDFFDCVSMCDVKKHQCTSRRITNNLQVLCRDIFTYTWPGAGLLQRMPPRIDRILSPLLKECTSKYFGSLPSYHQKVKAMAQNIEGLLRHELKLYWQVAL